VIRVTVVARIPTGDDANGLATIYQQPQRSENSKMILVTPKLVWQKYKLAVKAIRAPHLV
jgi:hypothetical protein